MTALANAFLRASGLPEKREEPALPPPRKFNLATDAVEERVNEHGCIDYGFTHNGIFQPVCMTCGEHKHANTGLRLYCERCENDVAGESDLNFGINEGGYDDY